MNKYIKLMTETILERMRKSREFQNYIDSKASLTYDKIKVYKNYGIRYVNNKDNHSIAQVYEEYMFNDIQKDDIVLDIGANIGAFSLFMSKMVKHVYAVEPMTLEILRQNIQLNNIKNITVLDIALGDTNVVSWDRETKNIKTYSLKSIIDMCGGHIDFLKLDCEGAEWCIKPYEFKGIRRIEAEIHNLGNTKLVIDFLKVLDTAGFTYTFEINTEMMVHATRR